MLLCRALSMNSSLNEPAPESEIPNLLSKIISKCFLIANFNLHKTSILMAAHLDHAYAFFLECFSMLWLLRYTFFPLLSANYTDSVMPKKSLPFPGRHLNNSDSFSSFLFLNSYRTPMVDWHTRRQIFTDSN